MNDSSTTQAAKKPFGHEEQEERFKLNIASMKAGDHPLEGILATAAENLTHATKYSSQAQIYALVYLGAKYQLETLVYFGKNTAAIQEKRAALNLIDTYLMVYHGNELDMAKTLARDFSQPTATKRLDSKRPARRGRE